MSGWILLLRHSLTEANEKRLYCGSTDLPLSPRGLALAERRARDWGFRPEDFDLFFTSGLRRTDETLKIFFGDTAFTRLPALREMDFGVFELQSYEMLKDREDYKLWISGDNRKNRCPGGESAEDMERRCIPAFAALLKHRRAVVMSHGGVIAAIMAHYFPREEKNRYQWQPEPAGAYLLTVERGRPTGYQRL